MFSGGISLKTKFVMPAVVTALTALIALTACGSAESPVAATVTVTETVQAQPAALSVSETCDQVNGYLATLGIRNPASGYWGGLKEDEILVAANGLLQVASRSSAPFVGAINTYAATMTALAPYEGGMQNAHSMLSNDDYIAFVGAGDTLRSACWIGD